MYTIELNEQYKSHDTVNIFLKKLCVYLYDGKQAPNNLYVYYKRPVDDSVIYGFLCNIFKKNNHMRADLFKQSCQRYFDVNISYDAPVILRSDAVKILKNITIKNVYEPVNFHYTSEGFLEYIPGKPVKELIIPETWGIIDRFSYLLSSFKTQKFYVVEKGEVSNIYFPFPPRMIDKKFIENTMKLEATVEEVNVPETQDETIINYLYLRGGEISGMPINFPVSLERLFDVLRTNEEMPFVKYKTSMNIYYKIYKMGVQQVSEDWTRIPSAKNEVITCKLAYNKRTFISVNIYANLGYSVTLSLGIMQSIKVNEVKRFIPIVNKLLKQVQELYDEAYIPQIPRNILETSEDRDVVRVIQIVTNMVTHMKSIEVNPANFRNVISTHMFPYFNLIETRDKTLIQAQFKKINNYAKLDNITNFIKNNYLKRSQEELLVLVMRTFNLSEDDAGNEIYKWQATNEIELMEKKKIYTFKTENFVTIKIWTNNAIDIKYTISGITSLTEADEIRGLIAKMMVLSQREKTKVKIIEEAVEVIETSEEEELELEDFDEDDEFAAELAALSVQKVVPIVTEKPEETEKDRLKFYFIKKLYEADEELFDHPEVKYSSACPWVDRKQPVVVTNEELARIQKEFPNAIKGRHVKAGSTREKYEQNNYICPKIWCPKSRVALSYNDYIKNKKECPYPDIKEKPILFYTNKDKNIDDALQKENYPYYLKEFKHPNKLCLPCCFTKEQKETSACLPHGDIVDENIEIVEDKSQKRYIKRAEDFPCEIGRFGVLSDIFVQYFQQDTYTGTMTDKTTGFFRLGVKQSNQSYLDVVAAMLDNPAIKNSSDLITCIKENLDILSYLSLEDGRIMKMFINTDSILGDETRDEFMTWFKKQKKYLIQMNLGRLLDDENSPELLREFVIYQSYKNFLGFLSDPKSIKDHLVCGDLINNVLRREINIHRYNFVVLIEEYDEIAKAYKIHAACSSHDYDTNYPFVVLIKRGRYYDPIVYVKELTAYHLIWKLDTTREMKKLLAYVTINCKRTDNESFKKNLAFFKAIGYPVKYIVLDYGYHVCGVIVKNNLYIPFEERVSFWHDRTSKYVYISDVPRFQCMLKQEIITDIYKKFGKFMKTKFYKIEEWTDIGLRLSSGIVPTHAKEVPMSFKSGLFILADIEIGDRRTEIFKEFKNESELLGRIHDTILNRLVVKKEEIRFILDKKNPLPLEYKKERMHKLLAESGLLLNEKEAINIYKYIVSFAYGRLYEKRIQRFNSHEKELLIDHFDVLDGKLKSAIEVAENPYKVYLEIASTIEQTYVFDEFEVDTLEDLLEGTQKMVPTLYRKELKGWKIISAESLYTPRYIYSIFKRISKVIGHEMTDELYEIALNNRIIEAFKTEKEQVLSNPWFKKMKKKTLEEVLVAVSESAFYYPSYFDIILMSELAGVNLVITGRKTDKNPDLMQVINNSSDFYVIVNASYDRQELIDTFSFYTCKNKIYFRGGELPQKFAEIIINKTKTYDVEIED